MAKILEYLKIAVANLKNNKGRSVLTMLGIIIGIGSVIMILAAGGGVRNNINETLDSFYSGTIYFYVEDEEKAGFSYFTTEDVDFIQENSNDFVRGASFDKIASGKATSVRGNKDVEVILSTTTQEYVSTDKISSGRYFTESEYESGAGVAILREVTARKLFGTTDVIGKTFDLSLNGASNEVTVIGLRADSDDSAMASMLMGEPSLSMEIPYTFIERHYGYSIGRINYLMVMADPDRTYEAVDYALNLLERKHHIVGKKAIGLENWTDYASQYDSILNIVTTLISVVAGIALLVGGIGVMNIMLVSVTERTREIGIRKSLGAKTKSIMMQFLAEAGMITLIGGVVGIVSGVGLAWLISLALGVSPVISPLTIVITTLFSCGIGLFFGIYPAKKAARLNPIEALRHE